MRLPVARARIVFIGLALGSSCSSPAPPSPAVAAAPAGAAPPQAPAPSAAPSPSADPGRNAEPPTGPEPGAPITPPALFKALFEEGRKVRYAVSGSVDPHSADRPGFVRTNRTVSCVVENVTAFRGAIAAELACQDAEDAVEDVFVATSSGLWVTNALPDSTKELAKLLARPPYLPASPARAKREWSEPPPDPNARGSRCIETVKPTSFAVTGKNEQGWCNETKCQVPYGYGPTTLRRCFTPSVGMHELFADAVGAPSTETWRLTH